MKSSFYVSQYRLMNLRSQIDIRFERPTDATPYHNIFITCNLIFSTFYVRHGYA